MKSLTIDFEKQEIWIDGEKVDKQILVKIKGDIFFKHQWFQMYNIGLKKTPRDGTMEITYASNKLL